LNATPAALAIHLTVDIGPDRATLGAGHAPAPRWDATWDGLRAYREALDALQARLAVAIPTTWFVRADDLVRRQFGARTAVLERFLASGAAAPGDDVGWLPQLPVDGAIDHATLHASHAEWSRVAPAPRFVRMGDLFHDNESMRLLDELGIEADCSAVPGRTKSDPGWQVDWRGTPAHPYHPSCADYRRPGAPSRRLLEVPMNVVPIRAAYDPAPLLRYVNPCFRPELLWQHLGDELTRAPALVCLLHPDELVPGDDGHPMVAYSPRVFADNLVRIVDHARALGRDVRFPRFDERLQA
jgi:hypothetical protein